MATERYFDEPYYTALLESAHKLDDKNYATVTVIRGMLARLKMTLQHNPSSLGDDLDILIEKAPDFAAAISTPAGKPVTKVVAESIEDKPEAKQQQRADHPQQRFPIGGTAGDKMQAKRDEDAKAQQNPDDAKAQGRENEPKPGQGNPTTGAPDKSSLKK